MNFELSVFKFSIVQSNEKRGKAKESKKPRLNSVNLKVTESKEKHK